MGLGGADDREGALEGDQELDELLFVPKPPLLAMRAADGRGESEGLACQLVLLNLYPNSNS